MFKSTKYIVLLIVVACSSGSKERELKNESINAVKLKLLDAKSFELIRYSLDTTFLHQLVNDYIIDDLQWKNDVEHNISELSPRLTKSSRKDGYVYETLVVWKNLVNRIESSIESDKFLIKNVPDTIIGYKCFVRYYSNSQLGLRVINEVRVTLSPTGDVIGLANLEAKQELWEQESELYKGFCERNGYEIVNILDDTKL